MRVSLIGLMSKSLTPPCSGSLRKAQGKTPTGCKSESTLGKLAEGADQASNFFSKTAIVSGGAALLTSETVVGGVTFGTVAAAAEGT